MRFIFALFLGMFVTSAAQAGEIVACKVPGVEPFATESAENYCDLHQRRLQYREESLEQTAKIKERQQNYHAPQAESLRQYQNEYNALNEGRSSVNP